MHVVEHLSRGLVPPTDYGGVQREVFWLARELVKRGHKCTVLGNEGSRVHEICPEVAFIPLQRDPEDYRNLLPTDTDVIHFQDAVPPELLPEQPFLITEHGSRNHFRGHAPNTIFVSASQARNHRGDFHIWNGIPVEEYPLQTEKMPHMLFMALLRWRKKNAKTALHLALDTEFPIRVCGGDLWNTPRIRGTWMRRARKRPGFLHPVGMVTGQKKVTELQNAKILFYLVNVQESFGLAPHEAMACGTPVLASPNGAMPEYIRDGENGWVVHSYDQAIEVIHKVAAMSPAETEDMAHRCRASAHTIESSCDQYLELFERVIRDRWLYPPERAKDIYFRKPRSVIIKRHLPRRVRKVKLHASHG